MLRIDDYNNAKPVFDKMQKKIDHCFRHLEKSFGISACARVEVPKPWVVRTFPYILPFGNTEFALKKSDTFRSYEIRLETPKKSGETWSYKASLDTPGSRVKRRFAGEFQVIQREGNKTFRIELASPFKSIGGSGSYTRNENSLQGDLEFHTDSTQVFSYNFTSKLMTSRNRKGYEASTSLSYMGNNPTRIDGIITITKGRKYHLTFDFKVNNPSLRPMRLRGSFTKEGRPTLSLKNEWRMSSDISLSSPFGEAHLSQMIGKISKQVKGISGNLKIDYQIMGMEKQTVSLLGTSQRSSGKINSNANFRMTQYPDANWNLNWNMQKQSTESLKNDIMLKYGRYPEKNYVHLKQNSSIAKSGHGLSTAFLEIPSLNVSYKAIIKHYLDFGVSPKIQVEADIVDEDEKHVKGLVDVKYESKHPLKANGKIEVEFPGGHYIYEGTVSQTNDNVTEGKSKFQYKEGKVIELTYKIETLNNSSVLHYEIESLFQTPSSSNPTKYKASLQLNGDNLILAGNLNSKYSLEANFKKALTLVSLKSSELEGKVEAINEVFKKSINMDLKLNSRRHVKALAIAEYGVKKRFHLEIVPSVESEPDKKILISSDIDIVKINNSRNSTHLVTSNRKDIFSLKSQDVSYNGHQEFHLISSIKSFTPLSLSYRAEIKEGLPKFALNFSRNLVEKAKIEFGGSVHQNDKRKEFSFKTLALSPDNSFENLDLTLNHKIAHSNSSTMMESLISFKKKAKLYKAELNSDLHPNKLEMKAKMLTPHVNFKKQAIGISFKQYNNGISSSVHVETPDDKLVSLVTDLQKNTNGYSVACTLNSPFDIVRDVQAQLTIEPNANETEVDAYIDVNNARLSELRSSISLSSKETKFDGSFRLMHVPNIDFEGLHIQYTHSKKITSVSGKIDLIDCRDIAFNFEIKDESGVTSAIATVTTPYESLKDANVHISINHQSSPSILLIYVDTNGKRIIDTEIKILLSSVSTEIQSRLKIIDIPEKLIVFKSDSLNQSSSISIKVWNRTASTSNRLPNNLELLVEADHMRKLLDFKISKEVSQNNCKTYEIKASGAFPLTSVTFCINRNERSIRSSEFRVCQKNEQIKCYSIMAYDKNLKNSENYSFYRKFSIDLKSSVGGSFEESKKIGGINLLSSANKYDFRSNMIFHLKGKAVGYDITIHKRQHENDHHSINVKFYHPLQNCILVGSILHNSNRKFLQTEFSREDDSPGRSFLIAIGREINDKTKEISAFIKMANPNMPEPLLIISEFQNMGASVRGKLMIRHNATRTKALIAEIIPDSEHIPTVSDSRRSIRKTLLFKLYTEDKTLNASVMLTEQRSKQEDKNSYEWDFNLGKISKKGAIVLTLSRKSKSIRIAYFVALTDFEVPRKMDEDLGDSGLSLVSREKKLREIRIRTSGSCLDIDVLSTEPFIKSSFCFNKKRGNFLQLINVDIYHRSRKFLDVRLGLDLKNPTFINGSLKWKKKDLCRGMKELSGLSNVNNECSLAKIKEQLDRNLVFYKENILEPVLKKIWTKGMNYTQDKYEALKNEVSFQSVILDHDIKATKNRTSLFIQSLADWKFSEQILLPLLQAFKCSLQKNTQEMLKYLPHILGVFFRSIGNQLQHCIEKFCIPGTLCRRFIRISHDYRLKNIKNIFRKLFDAKRSLETKLSKIYFTEVVNRIKSEIATIMLEIGSSTSQSIKLISRIYKFVEKIMPPKIVDTTGKITKKIYDRLSRDEDFITAKDLIFEAFKQLNKGWREKLLLIHNIIIDNPEKLLQERFQILTYKPEDGEIDFRIRQPLNREEIEILEREIQKIIDQLQGSLDV